MRGAGTRVAGLLLAGLLLAGSYEVTIQVAAGVVAAGERVLRWQEGDDAGALAIAFIRQHALSGGEGCESEACVHSMLLSAMRSEVGECFGSINAQGGGCATRTAVSGAVYRTQARQNFARRNNEEAPSIGAVIAAARSRSAAARTAPSPGPCVLPHCTFECATTDPGAEAGLAAEFVAGDPELRSLMTDWPAARRCGPTLIRPIFIGIPASEVVACVPRKRYKLQGGVRDHRNASDRYAFDGDEGEYKRAYRDAYFGSTRRKAGWDCLRHYEIVASGALPLFDSLEDCPASTLAFWPKKLLARISDMSSLSAATLDARADYAAMAAGMLFYAKKRLTTVALAEYVLETSGHTKATKILFLSGHPAPDYLRDMLLHGLKTRCELVVDVIKPEHMYAERWSRAGASDASSENLYGQGFSYARRLVDHEVDRSRIEERIASREFDVVVYGSVQRGMPLWPQVRAAFSPADIIFVDGEDEHGFSPYSATLPAYGHYYMRELPDGCPPASSIDPASDEFVTEWT